jgi:hypothetical protein
MVTIVKHEWHQVDEQFAIELDESLLSEIYPDYSEDEITNLLKQIEDGEVEVEDVINDAWDNDVDLDWEHQYSDCWTSRKGGYDITYELGDENSWHNEPPPPPPTHKCTKCKWTGQSYDAEWHWPEDNEQADKEPKKICPYCESDIELTEAGIEDERKRQEATARYNEKYGVSQVAEVEEENLPDANDEDLNIALKKLRDEYEELIESQPIVEETKTYTLEKMYPTGKYKIEIRGRTLDAGVGSITKEQFDYWVDREEELGEALNDSFDYEENGTPEECKLYEYYNEYDDIKFIWGVESDAWIIISKDDQTIYEGGLYDYLNIVHGDEDSYYEAIDTGEEFYINFDLKDKGPVVVWNQYGKGGWFDGEFEGEFDPKKLRFEGIDYEGNDYICKVYYGDDEIENGGGDYWGKYSDYKVYDIK